jgi:hypothetical protein
MRVLISIDNFYVDPFDEIPAVVFVGRDVAFANIVGSMGAVDMVDAGLLKKEVLKGFALLFISNGILHVVPTKASNIHVTMIVHILIVFAQGGLIVGLGVLT